MQEEVKISIIIPVYNVEKYLHECLDSIINQTFTDIEIICVDDGSTDKSSEILEEYEQKDKRFTVISQPNKGVSAARNRGMQQAKGKYIMFVDSDDWLAHNACEQAYKAATGNDCDMLLFSHNKFTDQTCTSDGRLQDLYIELEGKSTTFEKSAENIVISPCEPWAKLYKVEFLKNIISNFRLIFKPVKTGFFILMPAFMQIQFLSYMKIYIIIVKIPKIVYQK